MPVLSHPLPTPFFFLLWSRYMHLCHPLFPPSLHCASCRCFTASPAYLPPVHPQQLQTSTARIHRRGKGPQPLFHNLTTSELRSFITFTPTHPSHPSQLSSSPIYIHHLYLLTPLTHVHPPPYTYTTFIPILPSPSPPPRHTQSP